MSFWEPPLSEPGRTLWYCNKRYVLCHGPRRGGKSLAIADKMLKNAILLPGSETIILSRTLSKGEQGVWRNLTKPGGVVDRWIADGQTEYVKRRAKDPGPGYMPGSKVPYFRIKTGGYHSTFQLQTLAEDEKVEDKFKDMTCTQFYLVEADSFDREVFDTLRQCLRSTVVPFNRHQGFLDVNPPKEGVHHWLHKHFFERRPDDCAEILFPIDKNPFISEQERMEVYSTYEHDPQKLDRFYYGKWVEASEGNVFSDVFNENIVVVGQPEAATASYDDLDYLDCLRPAEGCFEFELGWDIGDQNSSVSLAAPRRAGSLLCYDVIDEVVVLRRSISIEEFVSRVMRMMEYWTRWVRDESGFAEPVFRHWSDSSSMNPKMTISGTEAMLINQLSEGKISLLPVVKGRGSVDDRKDLMRRMLYENRLAVSSRCAHHIDMLKHLPPKMVRVGTDGAEIPEGVDPTSQHKHAFDSSTYMLSSCVPTTMKSFINRRPARSYSIRLA